jgi:hypothetical protein
MGVDLLTEDNEYLLSTLGSNDPATQITPNGYFSGFLEAGVKGAVGGLAAVERTALDAVNAANMYDPILPDVPFLTPALRASSALGEAYKAGSGGVAFEDQLKATEAWAKMDPRTMGGGAMVLGSLTRGVTIFGLGTLAGGPVAGASTLGVTEGYQTFRDLRGEGVDAGTAAGAAAVTGLTAFGGAFVPASLATKSLLYAGASGAAINTAFGAASRGAVSAVLDANGYTQMADQYRALDGEAIAADLIIGAFFGGVSRFAGGDAAPPKPTTNEVLDAMEARRMAENARGTAGIPIDPATAKLDAELSDRALASILTGKPVDIDGSEATRIVENSLIDPQRMEMQRTFEKAMRDEYGQLLDTPEMLPEPSAFEVAPRAAPDVATEAAPAAALPDFDPVVASQIDHLTMNTPDLEIDMPYGGGKIRAAELKQKIAENMQTAEKESNLFNVAVACFLRTGA